MAALLAVLLALTRPPTAYVATSSGHVPLVISSWCWDGRCGAPIAAAKRVAVVPRDGTVTVELKFVPARVQLAVGGSPVTPTLGGHELRWRATRGGGITLTARGPRGFVTYVGRLRLAAG